MKLDTYCKYFESSFTNSIILPDLPVFVRIDGRNFHSFTKDMNRPFDAQLNYTMRQVAIELLKEWNANLSYTQSDEISLLFVNDASEFPFFKGKIQKLVSSFASSATAHFADHSFFWLKEGQKFPRFDARVWQAPESYVTPYFIWREDDAIRNSVFMMAQAHFSHSELQGANSGQMKRMLREKGHDWNLLPDFYKRGAFYKKFKSFKTFTPQELALLPSQHEARTNPNLKVERIQTARLEIPRIRSIENFPAVIFYDAQVRQRNVS